MKSKKNNHTPQHPQPPLDPKETLSQEDAPSTPKPLITSQEKKISEPGESAPKASLEKEQRKTNPIEPTDKEKSKELPLEGETQALPLKDIPVSQEAAPSTATPEPSPEGAPPPTTTPLHATEHAFDPMTGQPIDPSPEGTAPSTATPEPSLEGTPPSAAAPLHATEHAFDPMTGNPIDPALSPEVPAGTDFAPRRGRGAVLLGIGLVVLAVIVFLFTIGPFGSHLSKGKMKRDPAGALGIIFRQTFVDATKAPKRYPELKGFGKNPTEVELRASYGPGNRMAASYGSPGTDTTIQFKSQIHPQHDELAFFLSLDNPYFSLQESELYITPEILALRLPDLYKQHSYITADTENFIPEWNRYYGSQTYTHLDEDIDLPEIIEEVFESLRGEQKIPSQQEELALDLAKEVRAIFTDLKNKSRFDFVGEVGEDYEFRVIVRGSDLESALHRMLDVMEDMGMRYHDNIATEDGDTFDAYGFSSTERSLYQYLGVIDDLRYELTDYYIHGDIETRILVNKKTMYPSAIYLQPFEIAEYGYDYGIAVGADITFGKGKYIMDDFTMDLSLIPRADYLDYSDRALVTLRHTGRREQHLAESRWELTLQADDEYYLYAYDYSWDKKNTQGENLRIAVDYNSRGYFDDQLGFELRGNLKETSKEVLLSNAQFTATEDRARMMMLTFDYAYRQLSRSSLLPSTIKDSIDFTQVDLLDLFAEFAYRYGW